MREAINSVTPAVEKALYDPHTVSPNPSGGIPSAAPPSEATVSTQQLAFLPPDQQIVQAHRSVANAVSTRRPVDLNSRYASTSQLSFKPPPPRSYATPGWSERPTSNIGQPDVYKHARKLTIHPETLPKRMVTSGATMGSWASSSVAASGTERASGAPRPPTTSGTGSGTGTITKFAGSEGL